MLGCNRAEGHPEACWRGTLKLVGWARGLVLFLNAGWAGGRILGCTTHVSSFDTRSGVTRPEISGSDARASDHEKDHTPATAGCTAVAPHRRTDF
jgi:hypothetical protein